MGNLKIDRQKSGRQKFLGFFIIFVSGLFFASTGFCFSLLLCKIKNICDAMSAEKKKQLEKQNHFEFENVFGKRRRRRRLI